MTMEFTGFDMILANAVYARDVGEKVRDQQGRDVSLCRYMLPMVYTQPTEDAVVNYLMGEARRVDFAVSLPQGVRERVGGNDISQILVEVPQLRKDLLNGDLELLSRVRKNTPAEKIENPPVWLKVMYGVLPQLVVDQYSEETEKEDPQWYARALEHFRTQGIGEKFTMQLPLSVDVKLPERAKVDTLVSWGVYGSPVFQMNRTQYDINLVGEVVRVVYDGAARGNLLGLRDVSTLELQPYALLSLKKILEESSQAMAMMKMVKVPGNGGGPAIRSR